MDAENIPLENSENVPTTPLIKSSLQKGKRLSTQSPFSAASPQQRIPAKVLKNQNIQRFNIYEADPNIEQTFCEQTLLEDVTKDSLQTTMEAHQETLQEEEADLNLLDRIAAEELDKTLGEFSLEDELEASLGKSEEPIEMEKEDEKTLEGEAFLPSLADELSCLIASKVEETPVEEVVTEAKEEMIPPSPNSAPTPELESPQAEPIDDFSISQALEMPEENGKEDEMTSSPFSQEIVEKNSTEAAISTVETTEEMESAEENEKSPSPIEPEEEVATKFLENGIPSPIMPATEELEFPEEVAEEEVIRPNEPEEVESQKSENSSVFEEENVVEVQPTLADELTFFDKTRDLAISPMEENEDEMDDAADRTLQNEEAEDKEIVPIRRISKSFAVPSNINLTDELNFSVNQTLPPAESTMAREASNLEETELSSIPTNDVEENNEIEDSIAELPNKKDFSFMGQPRNNMLSESLMEFVLTENKVEYEIKTEEAQVQLQARISKLENELVLAQREREDYKFVFEEAAKKNKETVRALTQRCNELEMEAETLRQKELNESQIVNLEVIGGRIDSLMQEYNAQTEKCEKLEKENEAIKKEAEVQKIQLEEALKAIEAQKDEFEAMELLKTQKTQLEDAQKTIEAEKESLEKENEDLKKLVEEKKMQLEVLEREYNDQSEDLEGAIDNLDACQQMIEQLKTENATKLQSSFDQLNDLQLCLTRSNEQKEELQQSLEEMYSQKTDLEQQVLSLKTAVESAQTEMERMKTSSVSNEDTIEQLKTESDELKDSLAQANHKKLQLQASLDSMESQYNEEFQLASTTSFKVTSLEAEVEELKKKETLQLAKFEELEQEAVALKESLDQANLKVKQQEEMLKDLRETNSHLELKANDVERLEAIETEMDEMKKKEIDQSAKSEEIERELVSLKDSLAQANLKNEQQELLIKELKEQNFDLETKAVESEKVVEMEKTVEESKQKESEQIGKIETLEQEMSVLKESLSQVEHEKKQLEEALKLLEEQNNDQTSVAFGKIETLEVELKEIQEKESEKNQQLEQENVSLKGNVAEMEKKIEELTELSANVQREKAALAAAVEELKIARSEAESQLIELSKTVVAELEEKVEGLTTELYTSSAMILEAQKKEADARGDQKSASEQVANLQLQLNNTSNDYLNAQKEVEALKKQVHEMEMTSSDQSKIEVLSAQKAELEAKIQRVEASYEEIKSEAEMTRKSNNLTLGLLGEKVESLIAQKDGLMQQVEEISQENGQLKKELTALKELEQRNAQTHANQEGNEFLEKKIVELKARVQDLEANLDQQTKEAERAWKICDEMDDLEAEYKAKLAQASDEINRLKIKTGEIQNSEGLLNVFHKEQKQMPPGSVNNSVEEFHSTPSSPANIASPVSPAEEATPERSYLGAEKTVMDHIDKSPSRKNTSCRQQ